MARREWSISGGRPGPLLPLLLLIGAVLSCQPNPAAGAAEEKRMTNAQLAADLVVVRRGRVLFSHHSVGRDILAGIEQLDAAAGGERLRRASLGEAAAGPGPALIDVSGGRNQEPRSKIDHFATVIRGQPGLKPDLAFMKLCYVDFEPGTDVAGLFAHYRTTLEALKREHPEIRFAHATVPLVVRPMQPKWIVKRLLGREVWEDAANVKRAEFSRLVREAFPGDPVFDVAQVEATAPDGSLTGFDLGGRRYPSLYPGYSDDGGHLNAAGQRVAGAAAVRFLAGALAAAPGPRG